MKYKPHYASYYAENCMCILRCHIIFWGDKTITNLGITSWNVTLQNVNITSHKVRRREDMFYFALIATLWRTASKYGNNMYHYEECWFAAVSCLCIRDLQSFWWWIVMEMIPDRSVSVDGERVGEAFWSGIVYSRDVIPVWNIVRLMNSIRLWVFWW